MTLAVLNSCDLLGFNAQPISVEVHIGTGLPAFNIVGLPDARVRESRERVRSAISSSGFKFPAARITVNLAPADYPKASGRFDLPIALGVLIASGQVARRVGAHYQPPETRHIYFIGELSLTGALLPTPGCSAIALSLDQTHQQRTELVLPHRALAAITAPHELQIYGATHLREVVAFLQGKTHLQTCSTGVDRQSAPAAKPEERYGCLSDIRGQSFACQALELAAIGGHSLLMSGPPGVGKSMLAQRLITLLPPLDERARAEVTALRELAGPAQDDTAWPPFRAPHHSTTRRALIGGGAIPQPGEISLAHHGVLFLDELTEFRRNALEGLREPLESGQISLSRAYGRWLYPARFHLVAAMNPCPCGHWGHPQKSCQCPQGARQRYLDKISGPLLDRIDMVLSLAPAKETVFALEPGPASAQVRTRVSALRQLQLQRQGCLNHDLQGAALQQWAALCSEGQAILQDAVARWHWSMRVVGRIRKLARTLADYHDAEQILPAHVLAAIQLRQPLDSL